MNSNWFKLVMKANRVSYGKKLLPVEAEQRNQLLHEPQGGNSEWIPAKESIIAGNPAKAICEMAL